MDNTLYKDTVRSGYDWRGVCFDLCRFTKSRASFSPWRWSKALISSQSGTKHTY